MLKRTPRSLIGPMERFGTKWNVLSATRAPTRAFSVPCVMIPNSMFDLPSRRRRRRYTRPAERFETTWNKMAGSPAGPRWPPSRNVAQPGATFSCLPAPSRNRGDSDRRNILKRNETFSQCTQTADSADGTVRHDMNVLPAHRRYRVNLMVATTVMFPWRASAQSQFPNPKSPPA